MARYRDVPEGISDAIKLRGIRMRKVKAPWVLTVLGCMTVSAAMAGEREDYLFCVTDELGRGTEISEIGDLCLNQVRPPEEHQRAEEKAEDYPYEATLRMILSDEGSLFDPGSAQFKDLVYSRAYNAWCGQLNAKNRLGGYVGWKYFALRDRYNGYGKKRDYTDLQIGERELVEGTCKKYQAWVRENW